MTAPPVILAVQDVGHRYRGADRDALHGVSFEIRAGERVGLLGPNGAGKSTLMRLCCGVIGLRRGRILVAGHDVVRDGPAARRAIGYLPETAPLPPELRVRAYLRYRAGLRGLARPAAEVDRVLEQTGTRAVQRTPIGHLSRGYRQRVGLADALLGSPALLVLDEPTVGLDPVQVEEVRALLRAVADARALVFSSHLLGEVASVCERAVVLADGRVVADEPVGAEVEVAVRWGAPAAPVVEALVSAGLCVRAAGLDGPSGRATIRVPRGQAAATMERIGRVSAEHGVPVLELAARRSCLAERFLALAVGDREGAA